MAPTGWSRPRGGNMSLFDIESPDCRIDWICSDLARDPEYQMWGPSSCWRFGGMQSCLFCRCIRCIRAAVASNYHQLLLVSPTEHRIGEPAVSNDALPSRILLVSRNGTAIWHPPSAQPWAILALSSGKLAEKGSRVLTKDGIAPLDVNFPWRNRPLRRRCPGIFGNVGPGVAQAHRR